MNNKYTLNIGWLYPELMSTYGDRGNILCLKKRCLWRGIEVKVTPVDFQTKSYQIEECDMLVGGGAQDRQQGLVINDLIKNKKDILIKFFNEDKPGLFVCGSPQLLGKYYMTGDGNKLEGLDFFDYVTKHFGHDKPRCIGNTIGLIDDKFKVKYSGKENTFHNTIVGFENHGGRTYLGGKTKTFAKVILGFGNNGEDKMEGAFYKNVIACYFHGPFLPKNPHIADWLISKSLEIKYHKEIVLEALDDDLEWKAHKALLKRYNINL